MAGKRSKADAPAPRAPGCHACDAAPNIGPDGQRQPCVFCAPEPPLPAWFKGGGTATQRRRALQGRHPLNGLRLLTEPAGQTCGGCQHLTGHVWSRTYYKCDLMQNTKGPATETRVSWPACERFQIRTETETKKA